MTGSAVSEPRSSGSRRRPAARAAGACRRHPLNRCPAQPAYEEASQAVAAASYGPSSAATVRRRRRSSAPRRSIASPVVPMIPASTPRMAPPAAVIRTRWTWSGATDSHVVPESVAPQTRSIAVRRTSAVAADPRVVACPAGALSRSPTTAASSRPAATAPASIAPDASTRGSERRGRAATSVIPSGTSSIAASAATRQPSKEGSSSICLAAAGRAAGQMDAIRRRQLGAVQQRLADARGAAAGRGLVRAPAHRSSSFHSR